MTSMSKNVYIDKLVHIVNEYNNTYSTIKMKSIDVKSNTYIDFGIRNNDKDPKFEVDDHVRIPTFIIIILLEKVTFQIGLKKFLRLNQLKITVLWTYVISDINGEEIVGTFYKKELQKSNQTYLMMERL